MNMAAMQFVMYGTILAILWFGGSSIRTGKMQVGELTGFFELCAADLKLPDDAVERFYDADPFDGERNPEFSRF